MKRINWKNGVPNNGRIFMSSDQHFGHSNILKPSHCNRPFANVNEMNAALIANWNGVVTEKSDIVFVIGDLACFHKEPLKYYIDQLNGKIYLVFGNHDKTSKQQPGLYEWTSGDADEVQLTLPGKRTLALCHKPLWSWEKSFHGVPLLYGHIHSGPHNAKPPAPMPNSLDVGVDANDFTPIPLLDAIAKLS